MNVARLTAQVNHVKYISKGSYSIGIVKFKVIEQTRNAYPTPCIQKSS